MQERVSRLDGEMTINALPGKGVLIQASIPVVKDG